MTIRTMVFGVAWALLSLVGCGEADKTAPEAKAPPVGATASPKVVPLALPGKPAIVMQPSARGALPAEATAAAQKGDAATLERLLADHPEIATLAGPRKDTLLHKAAARGHLPVVKLLLARKADPNAVNVDGCTPVYWTVNFAHPEILELLLTHGGNPNVRTVRGKIPLHEAVNSTKDPAEHPRRKRVLELLLAHKAEVDLRNHDQETALHVAARRGHKGAVAMLLAAGADVNARNTFRSTPLDLAKRARTGAAAKLLAEHGGVSGHVKRRKPAS